MFRAVCVCPNPSRVVHRLTVRKQSFSICRVSDPDRGSCLLGAWIDGGVRDREEIQRKKASQSTQTAAAAGGCDDGRSASCYAAVGESEEPTRLDPRATCRIGFGPGPNPLTHARGEGALRPPGRAPRQATRTRPSRGTQGAGGAARKRKWEEVLSSLFLMRTSVGRGEIDDVPFFSPPCRMGERTGYTLARQARADDQQSRPLLRDRPLRCVLIDNRHNF